MIFGSVSGEQAAQGSHSPKTGMRGAWRTRCEGVRLVTECNSTNMSTLKLGGGGFQTKDSAWPQWSDPPTVPGRSTTDAHRRLGGCDHHWDLDFIRVVIEQLNWARMELLDEWPSKVLTQTSWRTCGQN